MAARTRQAGWKPTPHPKRMTRVKQSEMPMRRRVAPGGLIISFITFIASGFLMCSCPGFFVVMGFCAVTAMIMGSRLQRIFSAILILIAIGGFIVQMKDERRMLENVRRLRAHFMANSASASAPKSATKELPFVNSLGMKFVPVEITGGPTDEKRILFSIWDTRVQDYAEYAKAKGFTLKSDYPIDRSFKEGPTHPVVMVNSEDAKSFCLWLTSIERASGKIGKQDEYRLPSDREWSCAAGIGEHDSPIWSLDSRGEDFEVEIWRHRRFGDVRHLDSMSGKIEGYPWGTQWPPPKNAGN